MFAWTKKQKTNDGGVAPEVARAIRIMQDDLDGAPLPEKAEVFPLETPVEASRASSEEAVSLPKTTGTPSFHGASQGSPFLSASPEASPVLPVENKPAVAAPSLSGWGQPRAEDETVSAPATALGRKKKLFLFGSLGLIVLALTGGGVYYFLNRPTAPETSLDGAKSPTNEPSVAVVPPTVPIDIPTLLPESRFSSTQANFFPINTETVTADGLRADLLKTAQEVKEAKLTGAVEFLVRDQNYNPLAFTRFSYLAKLDLPDTLLATLDESFSLYIVVDGDRPRLGLSVATKNPTLFQAELAKAEKTLPLAISPLFIDTTTAPKTGLTFRSGSYGGLTTRFVNVDGTINLSVDHATRGTEWLLGTSQETLRAIIDKTATGASATPPTP